MPNGCGTLNGQIVLVIAISHSFNREAEARENRTEP